MAPCCKCQPFAAKQIQVKNAKGLAPGCNFKAKCSWRHLQKALAGSIVNEEKFVAPCNISHIHTFAALGTLKGLERGQICWGSVFVAWM